MTRVVILLPIGWILSVTSVTSQDGTSTPGLRPFDGAELQFMKHAETVYVFSVKPDFAGTPNQKDLRSLEPQARQALLDTLCNSDNWNWVTGGSEDCDPQDVGLLFQKSKDSLVLRFCSVCDPRIGCGVDGTFGQKSIGGWIKQQPWESWKQKFAHSEMRK